MRRIAALILACALALPMVSCAQKTENVPTWQEQYDLGLRYLEEGNYEEAILAFTAAIEIDPKRAEAYVGLADCYEGTDDRETAQRVIEEAIELLGRLPELVERLTTLEELDATGNQESMDGDTDPDWNYGKAYGTLSFDNIVYRYESGGDIAEKYDGAIGGIALKFAVNGPPNVVDVWVSTWRTDEFTSEAINYQISDSFSLWKSTGILDQEISAKELPFIWGNDLLSFPITEYQRGRTMNILFIGFDQNINVAGYAIVTVDIP